MKILKMCCSRSVHSLAPNKIDPVQARASWQVFTPQKVGSCLLMSSANGWCVRILNEVFCFGSSSGYNFDKY